MLPVRRSSSSGPGTALTNEDEGQGSDASAASPSAADGDEFDAIQRRIAQMRRDAMERIEAVRRPQPGAPARPTITPPALERPTPPRPPAPDATAAPPPVPAPAPAPAPPSVPAPVEGSDAAEWRWDRVRGRADADLVPPVLTPPVPEPLPEPVPEPAPPAAVGSVIRVSELPLPDLGDIEDGAPAPVPSRRAAQGSVAGAGLGASLRDTVERIAVTRSVTVLGWQALSVVVLIMTFAWVVWFPFAAGGSGGRALVVSDDRMAPTILRGDVVIVRASPDLPYPLDTVVAIEQGGALVTERIVGEEVTDTGRILLTRSDGVSVGPERRVVPQEIVGSVRRIHRMVGYPVLWFTSSSTPLPGVLVIVVVLTSVLGTAALVVRWDLKRSDRALVSAIASGTRNPPQH
jgi:hypothetical protein